MKQLVQVSSDGALRVVDLPTPTISPAEVLVAPTHSLVSTGTERAGRTLARSSLVAKARARPDLVKAVLSRARSEGFAATLDGVRSRLEAETPLGYSSAGMAMEVGEVVSGVSPGQRVAAAGAGHAELQTVAGLLTAPVPDSVDDESAAFATIGAIALHGLQVADVSAGSRIAVIGLGLIGQVLTRVALASGIEVVATDLRGWPLEFAARAGALALQEGSDEVGVAIENWTRGSGVDAVIIAAATSSSEPVRQAASIARDRGTVVIVGDVGLALDRGPLYQKELTLRVARSYGAGRYARSYESWGVDYPIGQTRWTAGRNLEAVLGLLARGALNVADLVTHRIPLERASEAYALLDQPSERSLAVVLTYGRPTSQRRTTTVRLAEKSRDGQGVGLIGAGGFARSTLGPALAEAGFSRLVAITSATGLSARGLGRRLGFEEVLDRPEAVVNHPAVDVVVIATPHEGHGELAAMALNEGKHVFCEKPLAITDEELRSVAEVWRSSGGHLAVGFNRRHSSAVLDLRAKLPEGTPISLNYRISSGELPSSHWYGDRRNGGRLLGEVCHFVDTCGALARAPVRWVLATGHGDGEAILANDLSLLISYAGGSSAAITYSTGGHPSLPKERLEVLGGGHAAVLDDFRSLTFDGKSRRVRGDKGHLAQLKTFREAIAQGGDPKSTAEELTTMGVVLAAADSLRTGLPASPVQWDSGHAGL